jgi:hypothetical protein
MTLLLNALGRLLCVGFCHVDRDESVPLRGVVVVKARGVAVCGVRKDRELVRHESQTYIDL